MNWSKLQGIVERQGSLVYCYPWEFTESDTAKFEFGKKMSRFRHTILWERKRVHVELLLPVLRQQVRNTAS